MTLRPEPEAPWWAHAFADVVQRAASDVALDRAAMLLAAHGSSHIRSPDTVEAWLGRLDVIAAGCRPATFDGWHRHLFVDLALAGNGPDYHDPGNSFLPNVLDRGVGIPISLSVVAMEIAHRLELRCWGIGMPGHFLIGHGPTAPTEYDPVPDGTVIIDAFNGGELLDLEACAARFQALFGAEHTFRAEMLAPVDSHAILTRMLANLKANYARARDIEGLASVMRLRSCLPSLTLDEGRELVRLLDAVGRLGEAWATLGHLDGLYPRSAKVLGDERARLASKLN